MRRYAVVILLVLLGARLDAHRLEVDYLREGNAVKVEVFYPGTGIPAPEADVTVTDGTGRTIAAGKTDAAGAFTFETAEPGPFTAVATHGAHRAEVEIPAVRSGAAGATSDPSEGGRPAVKGTTIHREPPPALQIAAGLGLLFGAAAFLLAVMARRRLAVLSERLARLEETRRHAP